MKTKVVFFLVFCLVSTVFVSSKCEEKEVAEGSKEEKVKSFLQRAEEEHLIEAHTRQDYEERSLKDTQCLYQTFIDSSRDNNCWTTEAKDDLAEIHAQDFVSLALLAEWLNLGKDVIVSHAQKAYNCFMLHAKISCPMNKELKSQILWLNRYEEIYANFKADGRDPFGSDPKFLQPQLRFAKELAELPLFTQEVFNSECVKSFPLFTYTITNGRLRSTGDAVKIATVFDLGEDARERAARRGTEIALLEQEVKWATSAPVYYVRRMKDRTDNFFCSFIHTFNHPAGWWEFLNLHEEDFRNFLELCPFRKEMFPFFDEKMQLTLERIDVRYLDKEEKAFLRGLPSGQLKVFVALLLGKTQTKGCFSENREQYPWEKRDPSYLGDHLRRCVTDMLPVMAVIGDRDERRKTANKLVTQLLIAADAYQKASSKQIDWDSTADWVLTIANKIGVDEIEGAILPVGRKKEERNKQ